MAASVAVPGAVLVAAKVAVKVGGLGVPVLVPMVVDVPKRTPVPQGPVLADAVVVVTAAAKAVVREVEKVAVWGAARVRVMVAASVPVAVLLVPVRAAAPEVVRVDVMVASTACQVVLLVALWQGALSTVPLKAQSSALNVSAGSAFCPAVQARTSVDPRC